MRQGSVGREGAEEDAPQARELGWDDSLYDGDAKSPEDSGADSGPGPGPGPDSEPVPALGSVPAPGTGPEPGSAHTGDAGKGGKGEPPADAAAQQPAKGGPRRMRRIIRWAAAVLSLLILGTAGAGYLYYQHLNGNIRSGERSNGSSGVDKPGANSAGQTPLNILLIGSDSRAKAENVKLGGSRDTADNPPLGDVQMLVHVSADRKNASVVSIPRDTRVEIPECEDAGTGEVFPATDTIINESLARGGPGCTLATWEKLTGVYIDHWMTIDFSGVVKMADAIGDVKVCVKDNIWDRPRPGVPGGSGLKLTAGVHDIKGEQALQWLRTRHAFYSDLGRAKAQHMYLNSMIRELQSQNVFTDAPRLTDLAEAATKSLEVSEEVGTVKKLFDLGMQLKDVPSDRITMSTMPTVVDAQDPNHLVPDEADAGTMWEMLRDDVAFDRNGSASEAAKSGGSGKKTADPVSGDPAAEPAETGVTVRNGTGGEQVAVRGRAADIADVLVGKGYALATAGTQQVPQEKTTVSFPTADLEGDAQAVAKALGIPPTSVKRSTDVSGVTVVVGADWRDGSSYPKAAPPKAGAVPDSAEAINGSDKDACMDVYDKYRW
ncbi:LCP family protein [Streptomyces sp. NPDC088116]|uniref:LCP family protein n=1 Tax=Streptomyces sp. NPDC088116 TaxID=3365825 RepID=UPI0038133F56